MKNMVHALGPQTALQNPLRTPYSAPHCILHPGCSQSGTKEPVPSSPLVLVCVNRVGPFTCLWLHALIGRIWITILALIWQTMLYVKLLFYQPEQVFHEATDVDMVHACTLLCCVPVGGAISLDYIRGFCGAHGDGCHPSKPQHVRA